MITKKTNHTGVIVPMITPFLESRKIDISSVEKILDSFIGSGVSVFLLGTTGESMSVSSGQKAELVQHVTSYRRGKLRVYAGISGNCLEESVEEGKRYAGMGVDAVVAHLPFYFPVDDDQMLKYYDELAGRLDCPLILYNNPMTTKHSVPVAVIEKLSYHPNIAGIKDSERGMERLTGSLKLWSNREDFVHLTGWAAQSSFALLHGSDGIIPSTGNFIPDIYQELFEAAIQGKEEKANMLQHVTNLVSELYQKDRDLSQSIPALKMLMSVKGLCKPYVLPPLYLPEQSQIGSYLEFLKQELKNYSATYSFTF